MQAQRLTLPSKDLTQLGGEAVGVFLMCFSHDIFAVIIDMLCRLLSGVLPILELAAKQLDRYIPCVRGAAGYILLVHSLPCSAQHQRPFGCPGRIGTFFCLCRRKHFKQK